MSFAMSMFPQMGSSSLSSQIIGMKLFLLVLVFSVVIFVLSIVLSFFYNKYPAGFCPLSHSTEVIWTVLPAIFLVFLGIKSLSLLYTMEVPSLWAMTLKVVGHQWYWSYEIPTICKDYTVDSYMLTKDFEEHDKASFRLLEVDNRVVLPANTKIRVLATSADVIHSWAIPSLSVKIDAIPGRLNQATLFSEMVGVFYGQCSEICGANHSFMPICVEMVPMKVFFFVWGPEMTKQAN